MSRPIFLLSLLGVLLIGLTSCDTQSGPPPAPATVISSTLSAPATISIGAATGAPGPQTAAPNATAIPTATALPNATAAPVASATPNATATATPTGMTIKDDGQSLVLSNTTYYWSMAIPRDWVTTGNNGFELDAHEPAKLAFVHLLAQTWLTKDRKPNAQAYVDYWKNSIYGNIFPIVARGTLVSQGELSKGKFGGPYLRYEFEDGKNGLRYVQVYASGGGPSSIVATVWAKSADYPGLKSALDAIINSVVLLNKP